MKTSSLAAGTVLALGLIVAVATPASAHSALLASTPADGETVTTMPAQFSVTANEPLLDLTGDATGFAIQVVDAAGRFYGDGCLSVADSTLAMGATLGEPGDYRLYWQVVSADGHPVSGELAFTWAPTDGSTVTAGLGAPPVCGETAETSTPTPTPTATPSETPTAEPTATAAPEPEESPAFWSSPLGIGAAVLSTLGLIVVIVLAVRALRRKPSDGQ